MPAIYALLVGINKYPVKPLSGCINDVNAVDDFLKKFYGSTRASDLKILRVTDEDAVSPTRANIVSAFDHFLPAGDHDTCFFYYSGHGSYSPAPPEFWSEADMKSESFVCIDSRTPGGKDLMDKEMGYLIWKTMQKKVNTRFIVITDCCHCGTITRNIDDSGIMDRMMPDASETAAVREWLGYGEEIEGERFYKEIKDPQTGTTRFQFRQGRHLHLSASRENQTAKELNIDGITRGAFTHSLLKILYSSKGHITYRDLVKKTAILVKNLVTDQLPGLHVNGHNDNLTGDEIFLTSSAVMDDSYLVYFDQRWRWCIKAGLIHGVSTGDEVIIDGLGNTAVTGTPAPDFSTVTEIAGLDAANSYRATIVHQPNQPLSVSFDPKFTGHQHDLIEKQLTGNPDKSIALQKDLPGRFIIRSRNNEVFLTLAGSANPLMRPIAVKTIQDAIFFTERIGLVNKWTNLLELSQSSLSAKNYEIVLYRSTVAGNYDSSSFKRVTVSEPLIDFCYLEDQSGEWHQPAFRLAIRNTGASALWISNAYLGFDYSISTEFFEEIELLAPGNEAWLSFVNDDAEENTILLNLDDEYSGLGYTEITEYLKIFIATQQIDTDNLRQDGLELPVLKSRSVEARSPSAITSKRPVGAFGWAAETIGFHIIRPPEMATIVPGAATAIQSFKILPHPQLKAKVALMSSSVKQRPADNQRSADNQPLEDKQGSADNQHPADKQGSAETASLTEPFVATATLPSPNTYESTTITAPHLVRQNSYLEPFDFFPGTRTLNQVDMFELVDVENASAVTSAAPLVFQLSESDLTDVVAIGFDENEQIYFPVGFGTAQGTLIVEALPEPTSTDNSVTSRSFIGSVKIYFQKVIGKKLGFAYDYPRLAVTTVTADLEVTYEDDLLKVSEAISKASKILLFIHGIIGDTASLVKCIRTKTGANALIGRSDLVLSFDYENLNTTIEENAALLKAALEKVGITRGHNKELVIVAHSMGGLVSRWLIEKLSGNQVVSRLVMLGTPNNGTPWADVRDLAATLLTYALNGAAFLKPWMFVLNIAGKITHGTQVTLNQMDKDDGIYKSLNDGTDPGIPYTIIAGNTKELIPDYEKTATVIMKLFTRLRKRGVYDALDSLLFHEVNDIAATDKSITEFGSTDGWQIKPEIVIVPSDHMNYFNNRVALAKIL
jgi:pimeloyl-ACP methyl ester carboxylesterase